MAPSTSTSKAYSSLFTAGLFSLGSRAGLASTSKPVPPPIVTENIPPPSISVRPPPSPSRKSDPSPRRRRKSSVTIGSSPMSGIKSPAQRAQYAQRSAQRSTGMLIASPAKALTFSPNGVWTVPENQILTRVRRGRVVAPKQKPAPTAPLPALPPLSFSASTDTGSRSLPRRDSETLPLPSPTLRSALHRTPSPTLYPQGFGSLLAPSPMIGVFGRHRSGSIVEEDEDLMDSS